VKRITIETADLVLVMGTSLSVAPFNKLVSQANKDADLILINRENTHRKGFDFTKGKRRLFIKGDCDEVITRILGDVGWLSQFNEMMRGSRKE
jgi:NAD-dependent histone deacetylase SIR2